MKITKVTEKEFATIDLTMQILNAGFKSNRFTVLKFDSEAFGSRIGLFTRLNTGQPILVAYLPTEQEAELVIGELNQLDDKDLEYTDLDLLDRLVPQGITQH